MVPPPAYLNSRLHFDNGILEPHEYATGLFHHLARTHVPHRAREMTQAVFGDELPDETPRGREFLDKLSNMMKDSNPILTLLKIHKSGQRPQGFDRRNLPQIARISEQKTPAQDPRSAMWMNLLPGNPTNYGHGGTTCDHHPTPRALFTPREYGPTDNRSPYPGMGWHNHGSALAVTPTPRQEVIDDVLDALTNGPAPVVKQEVGGQSGKGSDNFVDLTGPDAKSAAPNLTSGILFKFADKQVYHLDLEDDGNHQIKYVGDVPNVSTTCELVSTISQKGTRAYYLLVLGIRIPFTEKLKSSNNGTGRQLFDLLKRRADQVAQQNSWLAKAMLLKRGPVPEMVATRSLKKFEQTSWKSNIKAGVKPSIDNLKRAITVTIMNHKRCSHKGTNLTTSVMHDFVLRAFCTCNITPTKSWITGFVKVAEKNVCLKNLKPFTTDAVEEGGDEVLVPWINL